MKTLFTPGPWQIGTKGEYDTHNANCIVDSNGSGVCTVAGIPLYATLDKLRSSKHKDDVKGLANAYLIAEAPLMFELLSDIAEHLKDGTLHASALIFAEDAPAIEVIKASLARATQQPTQTPHP